MDIHSNYGGTSGIYTIGGMVANSLAHHGVPGMKHGKRRYQYPDGTLTPEGRIHYGYGQPREKAGTKLGKFVRNRVENHRLKKAYGKDGLKVLKGSHMGGTKLSEMSDEELKKRIERTRLEKELLTNIKDKSKAAIEMHNDRANRTTWFSKYGYDLLKTAMTKSLENYGKMKVEAIKDNLLRDQTIETERIKGEYGIKKSENDKRVGSEIKIQEAKWSNKTGIDFKDPTGTGAKNETADGSKPKNESKNEPKNQKKEQQKPSGSSGDKEQAKKTELINKRAVERAQEANKKRESEARAGEANEKREADAQRKKAKKEARAQKQKEKQEAKARERRAEERHEESARKAEEFFKSFARKNGFDPTKTNAASMFMALPGVKAVPLSKIFLDPDDFNIR